MRTSRPLDLICQGNPEMQEKLSDTLRTVAPHLTLRIIGGDAQALYALRAKSEGKSPVVGPLCAIRF